MFFDIVDDWYEGLSLYHLLPEILIGVGGMGCATFLFLRFVEQRSRALNEARQELVQAKKLASDWQAQASSFRSGLTNAISKQLIEWKLTEAEQEVCFLLLKGFSLQEIADLRSTSERTVRQQASIVYKKSKLSGRVQLAAFFLEDLLLPTNGG
jgi:DNA-binding NarL/FixJ family response regulator